MKFIASLVACLAANYALAKDSPKGHYPWFVERKLAYCHYAEDIDDWTLPRMLFTLNQKGPDDDVYGFKIGLQARNIGEGGDKLSINRFEGEDCAGDATSVSDGGVTVWERWGKTKAYYRDYLDDTNMCDFGSINLTDDEGTQIACCNVELKKGKECEKDDGTVTCKFFDVFGYTGWQCSDDKSCKLDPNTGTTSDQDGAEGCDSTCDPNGKDKDGADCGASINTCTFFENAGVDSGFTCTDGQSCTLDTTTQISVDQDGTTGCDSTCDANDKNKDGMACGDSAPATCTFFNNAGVDSGFTCTDGKSCTLDAVTLISVDQDGTLGCDSTCDSNGIDAAGAACTSTRRLAAQEKMSFGQN